MPSAPDLAKVKFGTSPKMSTYLLFFALGDFERATDSVDGTEVGVVTQRGSIDQARFALEQVQQLQGRFGGRCAQRCASWTGSS